MSYPRHQLARGFKFARRTSGDFTTANVGSTFTVVDSTLDLTLSAQTGDVILASVDGGCNRSAADLAFDFGTLVSAAIVNRFAGGASGMSGAYSQTAAFNKIATSCMRTLVAGDLSAGFVTVRFLYATTAAQTVYASSGLPLFVSARNLGPADPN